jgi:hypothetical protein
MYNMHNRGGCGAAVRNRASERRHSQRVHTWDVVPGCCAVVKRKERDWDKPSLCAQSKAPQKRSRERGKHERVLAAQWQMRIRWVWPATTTAVSGSTTCVVLRREARHKQKSPTVKKKRPVAKKCVAGGCDQGVTEGRNDRG